MLEELSPKAKQTNRRENDQAVPPVKTKHAPASQGHGWLNSIDNLQQIRHRAVFERLQQDITGYIHDAKRECHEIGMVLENSHTLLDQLSTGGDPTQKQTVIGATAALRRIQHKLANKLQDLDTYVARSYVNANDLWGELERVRLLSLTDHFTSLPNRRAFMQKLDEEIARTQRYDASIALALIDLDHFKAINDQYGHTAGDKVLKKFASKVLTELRQQDIVARYGGEEFAILFPNTDITGAESALKHLSHLNAKTNCQVDLNKTIPLPTFSVGLTMFSTDDTVENLIVRADRALYQAKQHGRNRIEIESPPT